MQYAILLQKMRVPIVRHREPGTWNRNLEPASVEPARAPGRRSYGRDYRIAGLHRQLALVTKDLLVASAAKLGMLFASKWTVFGMWRACSWLLTKANGGAVYRVSKPYAVFVVLLLLVSPIHAHVVVDGTKAIAIEQQTEQQLLDKSVAIVRGRVVGKSEGSLHTGSGSSLKAFRVRVLEIMKSDKRFGVGDILEVHLFEDGASANSELIVVAGVEMGDEVVLFLERGKSGRYMPILVIAPSY